MNTVVHTLGTPRKLATPVTDARRHAARAHGRRHGDRHPRHDRDPELPAVRHARAAHRGASRRCCSSRRTRNASTWRIALTAPSRSSVAPSCWRTGGNASRSAARIAITVAAATAQRLHGHGDAGRGRRRRHDRRRAVHDVLDHGAGRTHGDRYRTRLRAGELLLRPRAVELEQIVEHDQRGADRDRRVGDVERREVEIPGIVVHADEVDHVAVHARGR